MKAKAQRTKKSPLPIEASFPIPYEAIKFNIRISPDALKLFYFLSLGDPKAVGEAIAHILEPWYNTLLGKPGRGIQSGREAFTVRMKILIAYIDRWVTYWFGRKRKRWPKPLNNIVRGLEEQLLKKKISYGIIKRIRVSPHKVTAFVLEKYYGKERKKHRLLKWTLNPEKFRRTYLSENEFRKWFENKETPFPRSWGAILIISGRDPLEFRILLEALKPKLRIKRSQTDKSNIRLIEQPTQ